jgi:DNA-directed RNA polymerase specialized sigma24 family protein
VLVGLQGPNPEQLFGGLETREIIEDHIDELAPILRAVFVPAYCAGVQNHGAVKILSVPVNTVKARLWRARHQLAARLSRTLFYGECTHIANICLEKDDGRNF